MNIEDNTIFTTSFEVNKSNRFIVYFEDSTGVFIPSFLCYKFRKPGMYVDKSTLKNGEGIQVSFYNAINPSPLDLIKIHLKRNESFKTTLKMLDSTGNPTEITEYTNCKFQTILGEELDWTLDKEVSHVNAVISCFPNNSIE